MKVKNEKLVYFIISVAVMIVSILLVQNSEIVGMMAISYITIVGAYLGIDMAGMIKDTANMPKGEYREMDKARYIIALIFQVVLFVETIIISRMTSEELTTALSMFGAGALLIIAFIMGGLEGNKIATKIEGSK